METPKNHTPHMSLIPHDNFDDDREPIQIELDHYIQKEAHAFYTNGMLQYRPAMRLPSLHRSPSPRTVPGENLVPPEIQKHLDLIPNVSPLLATAKKTQKRHWYDSKEASLSDRPLILGIEGKKQEESLQKDKAASGVADEEQEELSHGITTDDQEVLHKKHLSEQHEQQIQLQDNVKLPTNAFDERRQRMFLLLNEQNKADNMPYVKSDYSMDVDKKLHSADYQEFMKYYEYSNKQMQMDKRDDERKLIDIEREINKAWLEAENPTKLRKANCPIPTAVRNEEMRQRLEDIYREKEFLLEEDEEWRDTEDAVKRVRVKLLHDTAMSSVDSVPAIEYVPADGSPTVDTTAPVETTPEDAPVETTPEEEL